MRESLFEQLIEVTDIQNVRKDEVMANHTTFRTGGNADLFVTPQNTKEAADIVRLLLANNIPFFVMGNGSNLLVSDDGYRGCIVCMAKGMDSISVSDNTITVGAGAMLSKVTTVACDNNLDGMVFASGIPGTIGGAITMNAGAYGGEMKDIVTKVTVLDTATCEVITLKNEEMNFAYRSSIIKSKPYIVLDATFSLEAGKSSDIKLRMNELATKRREKQPLEYPSAGSTFKRPEGYFAGKLIEDAGLKGYTIGGAQVSEKHSGFVINVGNATSTDIMDLIRYIKKVVNEKYGVMLETEVCMLGDGLI